MGGYRKSDKQSLHDANKARSEGIKYYKEMAQRRKEKLKYDQVFCLKLYQRTKAYLESLKVTGKPITMAGLILASGMSQRSWKEAANGDMDHQLEIYLDTHEITEVYEYDLMPCADTEDGQVLLVPMSAVIEKAVLLKEDETETRLYENGRVGDIFALKAKHGWIEEEKAPHTVNQTLVIASPKEAEEAIKLLK